MKKIIFEVNVSINGNDDDSMEKNQSCPCCCCKLFCHSSIENEWPRKKKVKSFAHTHTHRPTIIQELYILVDIFFLFIYLYHCNYLIRTPSLHLCNRMNEFDGWDEINGWLAKKKKNH